MVGRLVNAVRTYCPHAWGSTACMVRKGRCMHALNACQPPTALMAWFGLACLLAVVLRQRKVNLRPCITPASGGGEAGTMNYSRHQASLQM